MLATLILKEIKDHLLTFRFISMLLTMVVLTAVSIWVLGEDYQQRVDVFNRNTDLYAADALQVKVPSQLRPKLHRPSSPLSIFVQGETRYLGNTVSITRWEVPSETNGSLTDNALLAVFPNYDLLTIISLTVSIFGIVLTFDAISGEKERGLLKQILSNPVPRSTLYISKILASIIIIAIPVAISFLMGLTILMFMLGLTFTAPMWSALVLMFVGSLLYGAVFTTIGITCSAMLHSSSTSLVLSLFVWLVIVLLLPVSAVTFANGLVSLPPPDELRTFIKETQQEITDMQWQSKAINTHMWGSSGGQYPWLFDGNPAAFQYVAESLQFHEPLQQKRATRIANLIQQQENQRKKQASVVGIISSLSPSYHLRVAFNALSATGYDRQDEFLDRAQRFRNQMLNIMSKKGYFTTNTREFVSLRRLEEISQDQWMERLQVYGKMRQRKEPVGLQNYEGSISADHIPRFSMNAYELKIEQIFTPFAILAIAALLIFIIGYFLFNRYDIR
jgi:ABC-type transport system involved in multi-copper enzyme maturation permease subunit